MKNAQPMKCPLCEGKGEDPHKGSNRGIVKCPVCKGQRIVFVQNNGPNGSQLKVDAWVSVGDDMPEDDRDVLVSFKDARGVLLLDYSSEYYGQKGFWFNENGGEYQYDYTNEVSHWQYKPESATTPEGEHQYEWKDSVMQACAKCFMIRYPTGKVIQYRIFAKTIKKEFPCDKQAQLDLNHDQIK